MDQLVQLSEDLAELRDRVVEPALVGVDAAIPIEVHLEGLRRGVQRLKGFRKEGEERENRLLRNILVDPLPTERRIR